MKSIKSKRKIRTEGKIVVDYKQQQGTCKRKPITVDILQGLYVCSCRTEILGFHLEIDKMKLTNRIVSTTHAYIAHSHAEYQSHIGCMCSQTRARIGTLIAHV